MPEKTVAELRQKLAQAHEVIAHLMDKAAFNGAEAHRALAYFSNDGFPGRAMSMRGCGRRS
ncbi:hypothetical protein [Mesorhizobium sp. M0701]|uniref:hypothetical protein n=1 Tax=Mesorhizobium sp. M0701 TaxID=2956989 RepID=UPI003339C23B